MRHFENPYPDYQGGSADIVDKAKVVQQIEFYVSQIGREMTADSGDLYVGLSGIAYMYLKLHQSQAVPSINSSALKSAKFFINEAKKKPSRKPDKSCAFLLGNAGILCVAAIVNKCDGNESAAQQDLKHFLEGFQICQKTVYNRYGCDEILFGRAGYLSGIYWLNQHLTGAQRISSDIVSKLCDVSIESGAEYSKKNNLNIPLMWKCYGRQYLGAAHGISAILHMILESPMFSASSNLQQLNEKQQLVKDSIDCFLQMQSADGNFPSNLEDAGKSEHKLVHWCHGASGAIYLFAKAYLVFKEQKYLEACLKSGELVWKKGLLRKGPGICHGVAGSGYVFLLLYRLTNDVKHLYRASKFADFLNNEMFLRDASVPDEPFSLYEGTAGTVCFLIDLLQPEKAAFPFMDVFDVKLM